MPSDIALTDANFHPAGWVYAERRTMAVQPFGDEPHGPVFIVQYVGGTPVLPEGQTRRVAGWCWSCGWTGPERTGDPNSLRLAEDDAAWHYHQAGVRCGTCEACVADGVLRRG